MDAALHGSKKLEHQYCEGADGFGNLLSMTNLHSMPRKLEHAISGNRQTNVCEHGYNGA